MFKDSAGEKIWKSFDPDAEELALLMKGTRVQLIPAGERNGRTSHNIVLVDGPASPTSHSTSEAESQLWQGTLEEKRAIAARVETQAKLLGFCLETIKTQFSGLIESEESIRCLATTLYLSTLK